MRHSVLTSWKHGEDGCVVSPAGAKLTALDQFRQEKEQSEMERAELEEKLQEAERQHADYVYETEKKHVIGMHK